MQVTQTLAEGLKRQFKVVVTAADLTSRFDTELENIKGRVNLNGFRPGKVPVAHLKRVYGKSVMADVVQNAVNDANKQIVEEGGVRLAAEPKVNLPEDQAVIEKVLAGQADLDFSVDVELLPTIEIQDHSGISVTKEVAEVPAADVDEAIQRMASANRPYAPRGEKEKAKDGDKLTIDFAGSIDGVPFEGGTGGDVDLILGSGQFIPGFEEQLVGTKVGEQKLVKTMFPENYQAAHLAGKAAEFACTVKAIQAPGDLTIDDELAKKFGLEDVTKLREAVKESLGQELVEQTRQKMKRQLLDGLDALYTFELPPTMLEEEFAAVWRQVTADMQRAGQSFEAGEEDKSREEYRTIAARRVRLGLVLAEIGQKAEIKIEDQEITQALVARARSFPGQEKQVFEDYRKNPEALAEIRAPLFEEKVVDHLLAGVKVTEKTVTRAELMADDEAAEPAEKAEKPKKAKAKKADDKAE